MEMMFAMFDFGSVAASVVGCGGESDLDRLANLDILTLSHIALGDTLGDQITVVCAAGCPICRIKIKVELVVDSAPIRTERHHMVAVETRAIAIDHEVWVDPGINGSVSHPRLDSLR